MNRDVWLTDRAHVEMEAAYLWWAEKRSQAQAIKWSNVFAEAIKTLANSAERCAVSQENDQFPYEIRDLYFGIGRRRTHRAVFTIRRDMVLVLAVRHLAQQALTPDDII